MAKIQDHARPVGRVVALLVVLAAAAMLVRIPLGASAQAIKTGPAVAAAEPVAGQLDDNDAENAASETPQTPPLPIDRQPLATFGPSDDGDADLQRVAEVWNKLRGSETKVHGAEDLIDALKRVQESAAAENDTRNAARNDLPADRYADDSDDVYRVAERLKPLWNDDPDLLRFAQAAIANQRAYDAELRERVKALRKAARNLDAIAADLDDAEFYDEADELFDAARSLRLAARKWGPPPREMPNTYRNDIEQTSTWPPAAATPNGGWLYHEPTGQIAPNTPGHLAD